MDLKEKLTRRDVLKSIVAGAVVTGIAGVAEVVGNLASEGNAAEALKLIDEQKDFSAKALGFHHEGGKNPDRKDPKERCGNCKQFKKVSVMDGVAVGKCSLLAKGLVKETGWCRS
ncbi:MAG TPA: high-potential iron-sulfur protein, partial [Methylomirabilota bacterium]|nr:high-potential iron-sulfur protein [Methylomirabilota bacterium]